MRKILLTVLLVMLCATPVFADGECPERPANSQEQAAFQAVYNSAKAAVPPAPRDWVRSDETEQGLGTKMPNCSSGPKDRPLYYRMQFKYKYSSEASGRADQNAVTDALKGTPEQQAKLAELDRKIDALEQTKKEARKNRDQAAKDRVRDELKGLRREKNAINDEIMSVYMERAKSGQLNAEQNKAKPVRKNAEVIIKVNEKSAWIPVRDTPVAISGASQAYWCKEGDNGGRLVILLGAWDANFKSNLAGTPVITKAQNMVVEINGEQQMAESLARQMKLELLKKQL